MLVSLLFGLFHDLLHMHFVFSAPIRLIDGCVASPADSVGSRGMTITPKNRRLRIGDSLFAIYDARVFPRKDLLSANPVVVPRSGDSVRRRRCQVERSDRRSGSPILAPALIGRGERLAGRTESTVRPVKHDRRLQDGADATLRKGRAGPPVVGCRLLRPAGKSGATFLLLPLFG
jgi:hypothetical protein